MKAQFELTRIFNAASSFNKIWITKPKFNGFYSRNNLPKIKDETYVINLDEFHSIETRWIALYVNGNNIRESYDAIYFDSFKIKEIPKKFKKSKETKIS